MTNSPSTAEMTVKTSSVKLLVIDDNPGFRDSLKRKGELNDWTVCASKSKTEVEKWLVNNTPDLVLLDWDLKSQPGEKATDFAALLKARGCLPQTSIITGQLVVDLNSTVAQFARTFGGSPTVLTKPVDWETVVRLSATSKNTPSDNDGFKLENFADRLPPAVDVFDEDLTQRLWRNLRSKELATKNPDSDPLSGQGGQQQILLWLRKDCKKKVGEDNIKPVAARRIDYDNICNQYVESRLYYLPGKDAAPPAYWLARDWRDTNDRIHDHELLNIDRVDTLDAWLRAAANLLAQRYGVTRLRLYRVAPLPVQRGLETDYAPLIMPISQCGGGFKHSAQAWRQTGFLASNNKNTKAALRHDYQPLPEDDQSTACAEVNYGAKGTFRVLYPVWQTDKEGQTEVPIYPKWILAMDWRTDHRATLQTEADAQDLALLNTAEEMMGDWDLVIAQKRWPLMQGLVGDIGQRLLKWLTLDAQWRHQQWHEAISDVLRETYESPSHGYELVYQNLSLVCQKLMARWNSHDEPNIAGEVMGSTQWAENQPQVPALTDWYIALRFNPDATQWLPIAGVGANFDLMRRMGSCQLNGLHARAFSGTPWEPIPLQDYQQWTKTNPEEAADLFAAAGPAPAKPKSWLAVPMKINGKVLAALVVHGAHPHYFTELRCGLLKTAASRMLPLLAAAVREECARTALVATVMHEVKGTASAALKYLAQLPVPTKAEQQQAHTLLQHHLTELEDLGRMVTDILPVGLSPRTGPTPRDEIGPDSAGTCLTSELIHNAARGWTLLYESTQLTVETLNGTHSPEQTVHPKRLFDLRRVLRVLVHNAFRHGRKWVKIKALVDGSMLKIWVSNLTYPDLARPLQSLTDWASSNHSPALTHARVGLQSARQIVTEVGAVMEYQPLPQTLPANEDLIEVCVRLEWPIQKAQSDS